MKGGICGQQAVYILLLVVCTAVCHHQRCSLLEILYRETSHGNQIQQEDPS
jgi:hypothetical protein